MYSMIIKPIYMVKNILGPNIGIMVVAFLCASRLHVPLVLFSFQLNRGTQRRNLAYFIILISCDTLSSGHHTSWFENNDVNGSV
jgi:hypothetical protein